MTLFLDRFFYTEYKLKKTLAKFVKLCYNVFKGDVYRVVMECFRNTKSRPRRLFVSSK